MTTRDDESLISLFKADLQTRDLSPATTIIQYPRYIRELSTFTGGNLLSVDEDILTRYLTHLRKRVGPTSIKRYFSVLSSFFEFLVWKKYITSNPVLSVRKHYLKAYKSHNAAQRRQCISIDQAKKLVKSILDPKERVILVLLLKTGMRRKELSELDINNIDLPNLTIHIKPTRKRSNEIVYFDEETAFIIGKWLKIREKENKNKIDALFFNRFGNRLSVMAINRIVEKHAIANGLHDPSSPRLEDRFSPHSCRHWFTTVMIDAGCPRQYVQELRGDVGREAIDGYYHLNPKTLKESYLACIPKFGLM